MALAIARLYPKGHEYRVSYEIIYNCVYAQPVGRAALGPDQAPAPQQEGGRRGQIPDMLSIHVRLPEIKDYQFSRPL